MRGILRAVALLILAASLSGCIGSTFDISAQLPPAQPIEAGVYKNENGDAYTIARDGPNYKITKDQDTMKMALFASPENPKFYFLQLLGTEPDARGYIYAFASAGADGNSFVFYDLQKPDVWLMPEELRKLVPLTGDEFEVADAEKDTLHVLREIVRLGILTDPQVKKVTYRFTKP